MAQQMNYGPPQNSGRKLRDSTDSSARKLVNSSVATVPITRDLFTSQNPESPSGSDPITPNNKKSPGLLGKIKGSSNLPKDQNTEV